MKKSKFKVGDFVFMRADPEDFDEGHCPPNEVGEVIEDEGRGMYMVCVPKKFRTNDASDDPDGIREVDDSQMVLIVRDGKLARL